MSRLSPSLRARLLQEATKRKLQVTPAQSGRCGLEHLKIRTKDKRLLPFVLNRPQRRYASLLPPGVEPGVPDLKGRRELLLKARQFGFSTLILAWLFLDTINTPNTQTVVIAHDADSTERLFQIVQRFYQHLPEALKPRTRYANRREFLWPDLDSSFFVGQAGTRSFGRGSTINYCLASEAAYWPDAETLMSGLLQAVPKDGTVFVESTANGLGNWYHEEYQRALSGDSGFTPRFFGWYEHDEYCSPAPGDFAPTEEEQGLSAAYGLTAEQLQWRREKRLELREKFVQEYPANPSEAFIASGNPYFDRQRLSAMAAEIAGLQPVTPEIPETFVRLRRSLREGTLTIWEPPAAGGSYCMGADTAEGLAGGDYGCCDVFDRSSWAQVAQLHGKWDPHEYGLICAELGRWYHTALLAVERNNHGHAVIGALIHTAGYPAMGDSDAGAGGLYYHQESDTLSRATSRKPGWPTTSKSKYVALDGLANAILEGTIRFRSRESISELMTFVRLPGGGASAEGRSHDDRVTAAFLAHAMLQVPKARKREWAIA